MTFRICPIAITFITHICMVSFLCVRALLFEMVVSSLSPSLHLFGFIFIPFLRAIWICVLLFFWQSLSRIVIHNFMWSSKIRHFYIIHKTIPVSSRFHNFLYSRSLTDTGIICMHVFTNHDDGIRLLHVYIFKSALHVQTLGGWRSFYIRYEMHVCCYFMEQFTFVFAFASETKISAQRNFERNFERNFSYFIFSFVLLASANTYYIPIIRLI